MLNKGLKKYASNPVIGLLPFILFLVLRTLDISMEYATGASLLLALLGEIFIRTYYKSRGYSIIFYISGISLLLTLIIWFFSYKTTTRPFTYTLFCEAIVVCFFMLLRISKTYIVAHFFRQKNLLQKALLNEFYESATLLQYCLTLHIFGVLLYRQFKVSEDDTILLDTIICVLIPIVLIVSIGIYQVFRITSLSTKLRREEWLPIVTEKGEVTGKIAKSVSMNMKNKFMHPVVRVALISNSKVYMQERSRLNVLDPGKLDYPFEKYMLFNHEINLSARNSIRQMLGENEEISIKFLLKYVFENEETKRLIFLFTAEIDDENKITRSGKMTGKFWTIKQLEEGFADEIFSECFELEFEYLKNMVLQPNDITKPAEQVN